MKTRPTTRLSFPLAAAIAALLAAPSAQATNYYWDTNGAAGFGSITGAWNGVTTFWNTDITGATSGTFNASPTNADDLFINGGTTGTITLSGAQVASSLTFANNVNATLSGGTSLTIGGSGTRSGIFVNAGDNAANTISSPLILNSTSTALNFSNAGRDYLSSLTIGAVTGSAASGTQTITVGTSYESNITLNGIIGNGGAGGNVALTINSSGTGITSLTGANTYTGAVSVNAGVLNIQNNTALGTVAGGTTVASGAALNIQGSITVGAEALTLNGNGFKSYGALRSISGNNTYGGLVTLGSSTIINSDTAANTLTLSNAGTITGAGFNLTAGGAGNITINSNIGTTSGALTKLGAGTLTLSGTNTYTGNTLVRSGTLQATNQVSLYNNGTAAAWSNTNINVERGATLAFNVGGGGQFTAANINTILGLSNSTTNGFNTGSILGIDTTGASLTYSNIIANTNSGANVLGLTKLGTNTLTLDQNNSYTGGTTISSGTLQIGSGSTTGKLSATGGILNNGTLTINRSDAVAQGTDFSAAPIVGTGALIKLGAGTTTLNAANTYTGSTTVTAGVLNLTNALALQNSALNTTGAGLVSLSGVGSSLTLGGLSNSGTTRDLATIFSSGFTGTVTNLTLNPATGVSNTYGGVIANTTMSLTKTGLGTQILSGANTYTGDTIVNAGTLTLGSGATGSISSSSGLQMGGGSTFNYSRTGAGQTVDGLTVNAGNSTVNNTSGSTTLTLGAITRTASAYGTVNFATLTGAINTSTANTNGIIGPWATTGPATALRYAVGGGNITGLTGTTATAGTLANVTDATGNFEYSAAATTSANLTANTLRYSGAATTTAIGATNTLTLNGLMNAGTSTLTLSGGPSTGGIIIGNTDELVISGSGAPTTISAVIANGGAPGTLVYNGFFGLPYWNGILTLSGTNLYTGGTVINAGTLVINNNSALGSGAVTVNTGGTLSLGQYTQPNRDLTLNGGTLKQYTNIFSGPITLAANSNIYAEGSNFATSTIGGAISGAGGLTQNGPATAGVTLLTNASNTYTGPTVINNGALIVKSSLYGNDTSKWTPANITVASNAILGMSVGGAGEFTMAQAATMFTNLTTGVNNNGMRANSFMSLDTRNAPAGTYTYSAALTDSTGPGGGAVNFNFYGTGTTTLELTGTNTYSGATMVRNNGTLRVSSFNSVFTNPTLGTVHSASSSLGAPTSVANGTILLGESSWNGNSMPGTTYQSGNLTYTGTGETTDRVLFLGGYSNNKNYTLDQSGTGLLKFTSNFDQQITNTNNNLILAGSTAGTGEIAGTIIDVSQNGGVFGYKTSVTKNGTGTWTLSGANTYLGVTTINGGTLMIKGVSNLLGTVTVNAGGNFSLADGTARATTGAATGTGLTLATGSTMAFDWNAGSLDSFTTTGTATSAGNVGIIINNTSPTGSGGTLITAASGLGATNYFLANNTDFTAAALSKTATTVSIGAQTAATALTNAYWKRNQVTGALDTMAYSLGTLSNWASNAAGTSANGVVPGGSAVNLIFGTTGSVPGSPTLGADMNLGSITFNDTAAVTLAGSANAITLNSTSGTAASTTAALAPVTSGSAISVTSFANATNTISAKLVLGADQTWNVASAKTLAVSGVVSGTNSLTKADAGTLTLSGANIYNGATTVTGGTLKAGVASVSGVSGAFGYNSAITLANTAGVSMDITGFNTQIGSLTGGGATGGNVTLGAATLTMGGDHTSPGAYAGTISGTGGLTMIGNGTQTLSGSNTYTGRTTINSGTLAVSNIDVVANNNALGKSSAAAINLILGGGTLQYTTGGSASTDRNFVLVSSSTIDASGAGALNFSQTGNISPDVTGLTFNATGANKVLTNLSSTANLVVGMTITGTGIATGSRIASIDSATQVTLDSSANVTVGTGVSAGFGYGDRALTLTGTNTNANTIAGNLVNSTAAGTGVLSVTKSGAGTWNLSGSNTYTGATTISGGSLQIGAGGTTGALTGTASITNNANLTINRSDAFTQAAGLNNKVISGTGSFTQAGGGTTTLSLTNTYTGATNVTTGTLQLDGSTHASSAVGIGTAGTLTGTGTVNGNATLTGNGTINKASGTLAGTLGVTGGNWNGAGAVTGLVTSSSGILTIGSGANLTANGNLNVTGGTIAAGNSSSTITGSLNYTSSSNSDFAGVIAGADKTLTMNNATGTLTLSGANTYTGATNVAGGKLLINGSTSTSSAVTVANGATLGGSGAIGGSVTVQSGGTFAPGNSIESIATGNLALLAGAVFAQEIDKSAALGLSGDLTAITGSLSITSGAIFSLNEIGLSGAWTAGDKITLIGYSTGTWNGGLFTYLGNTLNDDSEFTFSGIDWAFNYNDATLGDNYPSDLSGYAETARYVTMTAVPETNVAALIGGFGVLMLVRRRR